MSNGGSLRITPGAIWTAKSAINTLVPGRTVLTATGWFQFNSYTGQVNSNIFTAIPVSGIEISSTGSNQVKFFLSGVNSLLQYAWPISLGQSIFWALTLNSSGISRIWINAGVVAAATNIGAMPATPTSTQVGWQTAGNVDLLMSEPAIYPTELTGANLLALRDRTAGPADFGATSYWMLQGTAGLNPTTADAGLHDQIGSNHLTTITGLSTSAVYSATALNYTAPITITEAQVQHWGYTIAFMFGTNPALGTVTPAYPIAAPATTPTVKINGVQAQLQGAFWSSLATGSVAHEHPYYMYHIVGGVQPGDVVTYETADAWATFSQGHAAAESGTAGNYVGLDEPGLYGFQGMALMGATMGLGYNCPSNIGQHLSIVKNNAHRCPSPWFNAASSDSTGYPLTANAAFSGIVSSTLWDTSGNNGVDSRAWSLPEGTWVVVGDEYSPATPNSVFLTANSALNQAPLTAPTIILGTVDGNGHEIGKQFVFTVGYVANPTTLNASVGLNIQTFSHGAGAITFKNARLFEAGNAVADPYNQVLDDNISRMLTASPGIEAACIRQMEALDGSDGDCGIVDAEDEPVLTDFGYNGAASRTWQDWTANAPTYRGSRQIPIYQFRKYDTTTSPNVYMNWAAPRTVASDNAQCGPFMWVLADLGLGYDWGFHGVDYTNNHLMPIEVVCALSDGTLVNHNLKTGQPLPMPAAVNPVGTIDDQGHTGFANTNVGVKIFVTGPSTFMFVCPSGLANTSKMGYVSGGPYTQQTAGVNINTTLTIIGGNHPRIEDVGCIGNTLAKTHLWVANNAAMSDAGVRDRATRLFNSSPRGTIFHVQFSNEIEIGNQQNAFFNQVASIEGFRSGSPTTGTLQPTRAMMKRMAEVHAIYKDVWGSDAASIKRVYQCFTANTGGVIDALMYAQAQGIEIDEISTSGYIDGDFSPPYRMAAAMVAVNQQRTISGTPTFVSIAHPSNGGPGQSGILQTWVNGAALPMAALHEMYGFHIKYAKPNNSSMSTQAVMRACLAASGYTLTSPTNVIYEGAPSTMIPGGVSTQTKWLRAALTHDFAYHPAARRTWRAYYQAQQQPGPAGTVGATLLAHEALHGQRQAGTDAFTCADGSDVFFVTCWQVCPVQGQQVGDGTSNLFALSDLGGDGLAHDWENESVIGLAGHDWINAVGGGVVPANPRKRRWVRRFVQRVRV